ncbi:hypothetical protein [Nocardioides sp. AE5]|uniref:hypothetical protein n=1 Tax=Nocardioides sp. AE5 TaxID=2962573 RepID=UPI002881CB18|nr:hypothetical protein [Nocardioides sp. AE5]MDT0201011.1 hypothetical protein [Nocardioides sp. AE5]
MSDLQCPARVYVVPGSVPSADAVPGLREANVARVYGDSLGLARAVTLADELDAPVELRLDLPHLAADSPIPAVLDDLADVHRGEAIALVVDVPEALVCDRDMAGWRIRPIAAT